MAEYDLTSKVSHYLDRHLIIPLLEYIGVKSMYDGNSILRAKLELLMGTSMVDFAACTYKALYDTDNLPEDMIQKRQYAVKRIHEVEEKMAPIDTIFSTETMKEMVQCKVAKDLFQNLEVKYNFKTEMLDDMFEAAKVFYDSGLYNATSDYLRIIRQLIGPRDRRHLHACWGRLASEILVQNWDEAMDDVEKLKDAIDLQSEDRSQLSAQTYLFQLQQRTWLLHWSLFVFFNHSQGKEKLIDFFLNNPNHLNAIQTLTPHLLRYLAVCVIVSIDKKKKSHLRDLVYLIQQESYSYQDPVTEFLECLYIRFDFDKAQQKLKICEMVLPNDFFLTGCYDDFIENARLLMFEAFCRIHHCVGINMLAEKLNMNSEDAERWIVNLIRGADIDAKIDSKKGLVFVGTQMVSPYQQVVEKTRNSAFIAAKLLDRLKSTKLENHSWSLTAQMR